MKLIQKMEKLMSSGYVAGIIALLYFLMFLFSIGIAISEIVKGNVFALIILLFSPLFFLPAFYAYEYNKKDNLKEEKERLEKENSRLKEENERAKKEYYEIKGKTESYIETNRMLKDVKDNIEEMSKKVGRKRYECSLCGTVFFTDSVPTSGLVCPKCRSEFVADTSEKLGRAFEMWCMLGYGGEKGIFRVKKGGWKCERGPLSKSEFIERFRSNALPERDLPDFKFFYRYKDIWEEKFQIECKWRNSFENGRRIKVENLKKYEKFNNESHGKVFLVVGVGGTPLNPGRVFVIPYDKINEGEKERDYISERTLEKKGSERKYPNQVLTVEKGPEIHWIRRIDS